MTTSKTTPKKAPRGPRKARADKALGTGPGSGTRGRKRTVRRQRVKNARQIARELRDMATKHDADATSARKSAALLNAEAKRLREIARLLDPRGRKPS